MIDLHLHILPGIDDGSRSMDESVEMARRLVSLGFKGGFCTSHFIADSEQMADNATKDRLRLELQKKLDEAGIDFRLLAGNEVYIDPKMVSFLEQGQASLLGGDLRDGVKYLLFELPFYTEAPFLRDMVFELKAKGITPILAHPERYLFLQKKKKRAFELIKMGLKLQCNIGSMVNQYGGGAKRTMKFLLKNQLVSVLGTDTHRANASLFDNFEKARTKIIKVTGEREFMKMIENSEKIAGKAWMTK